MSTFDPSQQFGPGAGRQPSEAEIMAAYEQQMKMIRVEEVVVQSLAGIVEVAGRKAGLAGGSVGESDPEQVKVAIDAIVALQPVVNPLLGESAGQIDAVLSQLQLAYSKLMAAREAGASGKTAEDGSVDGADSGSDSPAAATTQPSANDAASRLWVPGQ